MTISKDKHTKIIDMYKNGYSYLEIAEILDITEISVRAILSKYGLIENGTLSRELVETMFDMYNNGIKVRKIAEIYQIDRTTIYKYFKKYNLQPNESHAKMIYSLNEHYFDEINTPNKAYILGLLYADGCNKSSKHQVDLSLQADDKHILDEIKKELNCDKPLSFYNYNAKNPNHKDQYRLCIVNKHMSKTLYNCGVVDAKSLILEFPEWLDSKLYSHFIRGYMDGDGCIWVGEKLNQMEVSVVSTVMFIKRIQEIIKNVLNVNMSIKTQKHHNPITKVGKISGRYNIQKFLDWIYKDAEMKLIRKYNKYQKILELYN